MAQTVGAWIYGQNGADWNESGGLYWGFPTQQVVFIPLKPTIQLSGATMHSKIKVLGSTYATSPEFYTDKTVTTLETESNA